VTRREGSTSLIRHARAPALLLVAVATAVTLPGSAGGVRNQAAPAITASVSGTGGSPGWYVSDVTVAWSVADPQGIRETRGCDTRTFTQETTRTDVTCWAISQAGFESSTTVTLRIDKTPPAVRASLDREADFNGWYTRPVNVRFSGGDAVSGLASCSSLLTYAGPDTPSGQVSGTCRDRAGNQSSGTVALKYDATAPVVTEAIPARTPDRYGWYNQAVAFSFTGADATSGTASCSTATYSGPNNEQASVTGTCWDNAGHASAPRVFWFRYSRPLVTPVSGQNVGLPVRLDWVNVEGARFYNVQIWKGSRKILSVWPSGNSYTVKRSWRFGGKRYALERGKRYRWYVWPRVNGRYGALLGGGIFNVARRAAA
jgi:hypothetical protein